MYAFPSRQLVVIAITGTKGKSTTTEIIGTLLEAAGHTVAISSTVRFKLGKETTPNLYKMTMPGRFFLQRFLRQAISAKCTHAVIEMTSEGARLYRHRFIDLDALVVTNIAPEHIEAHGSYERYLDAKLSIARALSRSLKPDRALIVNKDDAEAERFLKIPDVSKQTYALSSAEPYTTKEEGLEFMFDNTPIVSTLSGKFNLYNLLAAMTCAKAFGVPTIAMQKALVLFRGVPGRLQKIEGGQDFSVFVDYAHTAESLEAVYETFPNKRKICVFGSTGGGRDKWKRPKMGSVADKYCAEIILTNDDPYEENPQAILEDIATGIQDKKPEMIVDRRLAIRAGLSRARAGDVVLITGKGTDPYLMEANGKKTPWSDAEITKEELRKLLDQK